MWTIEGTYILMVPGKEEGRKSSSSAGDETENVPCSVAM
jgi:hypothetical protein